jgi:hypothetical protein
MEQIAKCPNCGQDIHLEDVESDHVKLALASGALIGSAAVVGMLVELPQYDGAKQGYDERIAEIIEVIHQTADHLTEWGEAYDD